MSMKKKKYHKLRKKSKEKMTHPCVTLPPGLKKEYVIFSKSGFKDNLEQAEGRFYTY